MHVFFEIAGANAYKVFAVGSVSLLGFPSSCATVTPFPSTPQLPLRGAQQLAQMYIDEGHTLTWPTSSECDGINSQTMKMIFDANSEFLLTEYVHGWNIHCISPC